MSAQAELGPVLPPRCAVRADAVELLALARLATELTTPGPQQDLGRALRQFERMRAVLGPATDLRAAGGAD